MKKKGFGRGLLTFKSLQLQMICAFAFRTVSPKGNRFEDHNFLWKMIQKETKKPHKEGITRTFDKSNEDVFLVGKLYLLHDAGGFDQP